METRLRARLNEETEVLEDTDEGAQQQQQTEQQRSMDDREFTQLVAMFGKQMDLLAEQKITQTEHMEQIRTLIGGVNEKLEEISKRQDRLEYKQKTLEKELADLSEELVMSGNTRQNTLPVNVECFEARLDVVENRVERFGERLQRMQEETVLGLKETVLEDLLKEINIRETRSEKARVVQAKKSTPENCVPAPVGMWTTPNFPSSEKRSVPLNDSKFQQPEFSRQLSSTNAYTSEALNPSGRIQKPTSFDGSGLWESYYAQFEIVAKLNNWNDHQKAAYLATSLKGPALAVLGNLAPADRQKLDVLVVALKNRFGASHQTELSRMKFKNRVKQRDESLPELAEDIERLSRLSYPDAPPTLRDVLARDQFMDALPDEDTRLRIKQERPPTLRRALETALELESFSIAARQRNRVARGTELLGSQTAPATLVDRRPQRAVGNCSQLEEGSLQVTKILERLERSMKQCLDGVLAAAKERQRPSKDPGCWNCGDLNHIRRNCPKAAHFFMRTDGEEGSSKKQGNGK